MRNVMCIDKGVLTEHGISQGLDEFTRRSEGLQGKTYVFYHAMMNVAVDHADVAEAAVYSSIKMRSSALWLLFRSPGGPHVSSRDDIG